VARPAVHVLLGDLDQPGGNDVSWQDLSLIGGPLFLTGKSVYEIHDKLERPRRRSPTAGGLAGWTGL
jgi:hypothetical protein